MVAKDTAVVLAEASEVVEDAVDILEDRVSWLVKNPKALIGIALLTGVVVGSAATYLVVRQKLTSRLQAEADEQIQDVKDHYAILNKTGPNGDLAALASVYSDEERAEGKQIVEREGYMAYDKVRPSTEKVIEVVEEITVTQAIVEATLPIERNVFESDNADDYFIFAEELEKRAEKPDEPFVITKEEWDANETDYDQAELTYYEGDDVLTDSKEKPVEDTDGVVGNENLLRFGHGSGDPKVVYIRNNNLSLDFEMSHSSGKFAKEVLGFDDELTHSDRRPRKFRASDE
jgi:hypothetical protein